MCHAVSGSVSTIVPHAEGENKSRHDKTWVRTHHSAVQCSAVPFFISIEIRDN